MRRIRQNTTPFEDTPLGCLLIIALFGIIIFALWGPVGSVMDDVNNCLQGGDAQACGRCAMTNEACARANAAHIMKGNR